MTISHTFGALGAARNEPSDIGGALEIPGPPALSTEAVMQPKWMFMNGRSVREPRPQNGGTALRRSGGEFTRKSVFEELAARWSVGIGKGQDAPFLPRHSMMRSCAFVAAKTRFSASGEMTNPCTLRMSPDGASAGTTLVR